MAAQDVNETSIGRRTPPGGEISGSLNKQADLPPQPLIARVNSQSGFASAGHGVTGGTVSVGAGISTVLKSAGLTISRYSMSGE